MTPRAAGIASGDARPRWTAPELTNPSSSPRLKGEVIFMSQDNQGEIPRVNPQPPVESRGQRPQNLTLIERRQELAREYFNRVNAGRVVGIDEKRIQEEMVRRGIWPEAVSGGATAITVDNTWRDPLKAEITGLNIILGPIPNEDLSDQLSELIDARRRVAGLGVPDAEKMEANRRIQERINALRAEERQREEERERERRQQREEEQKRRHGEEEHLYENPRFQEIFRDENVRRELDSDIPNFSRPELEDLRNFMDTALQPMNDSLTDFAYLLANDEGMRIGPAPEDIIPLSRAARKILFEWTLERIISIPDLTPDAHYNIGSLTIQNNLDRLRDVARRVFSRDDQRKDQEYFAELIHYRQVMHDFNLSLREGEEYKKYIISALSSNGFDFVQNHLVGVSTVLRLLEKSAANKLADKGEWLDDRDIREINEDMIAVLDKLNEKGEVSEDGRVLTQWEIDRAKRIADIFFKGTQRQSVYAGYGKVSSATASRIASLPREYIGRAIFPWKMTAIRFFGGDPGPRAYMKHVFDEMKDEEFLLNKGEDVSIFGLDKATLVANTFGAPDLQSHSWRSELLYLGNPKIRLGEREQTLLDYLNSTGERYRDTSADTHLMGLVVKEKDDFSKAVRDVVLGQRLYLSCLVRYGNFNDILKTQLWQKIASLKPSTIASFLPGVVQEEVAWQTLRQKLYIAEEERVRQDWEHGGVRTEEELTDEAQRFLSGESKYEMVDRMSAELTTEERALLRKIIDKGYDQATELARINTSYAMIVDDAPFIAWKKQPAGGGLETEDYLRLLGNDQKSLGEGWGALATIAESPEAANVEAFSKALESLAGVFGRKTAQGKVEPFITSTVKMFSINTSDSLLLAKHMYDRLFQKPISEIEEHYRHAYYAMDASDKKHFLIALEQARVLNFDQVNEMRKKVKATEAWIFLTILVRIAQFVGGEAALAFMNMVIPSELLKAK